MHTSKIIIWHESLSCSYPSQVQTDITELRQKWVEHRVERVTSNTFKLYQIREQLKQCKVQSSPLTFP